MIFNADGSIQLRMDTPENWESADPILRNGELAIVVMADGNRLKAGDGVHKYSELGWTGGGKTEWGGIEGDIDEQTDLTEKFSDVLGKCCVVGMVIPYAGQTAPSGWLLCNGSAVSRTDYAELFEVISTKFGSGDGSTTFNVPNLTDKFIEGGTVGTVKEAGLPNITGEITVHFPWCGASGENNSALYTTSTTGSQTNGQQSQTYVNKQYLNASRSNPIYGKSNTVQPPAVCMNFIIKY